MATVGGKVAEALHVSDGPACELCELLVQTVDQYLKENKTETAINATIYKLCNDLPASIKSMCLSVAPLVVTTLSNGVDPKQACTLIRLCDSTGVHILPLKAKHLSDGPACELCELLVQTVDQYLKENKTEAAINATIYKLCNDLPASIKSTCLSVAPLVVTTLSNGVDPKQACTFIKLCDSTAPVGTGLGSPSVVLTKMKETAASHIKINWCTVCKDHISIIDQDLYKEESTVQQFLDGICHRFPPPTDQVCLTAADTKFPEIWEEFLNGTGSAENVCKLLKVCIS